MDINQLLSVRQSQRQSFVKTQSKQEFFTTKRREKRLKISRCYSQPTDINFADVSSDDNSFAVDIKSDLFNEQLLSTFGSEQALTFKPKPLRKKRNQKLMENHHLQLRQCSEESDGELSVTSPFNRKIKHEQVYVPKQSCNNQQIQKVYHKATIQDFIIFQRLGEGTYSQVFRAIEKHCGFLCALKIMDKQKLKDMKMAENIVREIKMGYFLQHTNIIKIYTHFDDQNFIYLVSEYATDRNLFEAHRQPRIKLKKGMMTDSVSRIISQLSSATKYLHNHHIIHRDIKPENILITIFDTVKLCDFGWAVYSPDKEMRSTLCGTPLYLAPELVSQDQYDESVDVWAIGILTYELVTDQNPFKIAQLKDIKKIVKDEVKFEGIRNKNVVDFLSKALEKDPKRRKTIYELNSHPFLSGSVQEYTIQM